MEFILREYHHHVLNSSFVCSLWRLLLWVANIPWNCLFSAPLSLSGRIVSCRSSLLDHRPIFAMLSLFLVCLAVFIQLFSAIFFSGSSSGVELFQVCMGTRLWQDGAYQQVFHGLFIPTFARCLSILVECPFLHKGFAASSPCPEAI